MDKLPTIKIEPDELARAIAIATGATLEQAQHVAVAATDGSDLAEARRRIAEGAPPDLVAKWLASKSE